MSLRSKSLCAAATLGALFLLSTPAAATQELPLPLSADFAGEAASAEARYTAAQVMALADNKGLPFVIIDKKGLFVNSTVIFSYAIPKSNLPQ